MPYMLQFGDTQEQGLAFCEYPVAFRVEAAIRRSKLVSILVNRILQLQGKFGFGLFDAQIREYTLQKLTGILTGYIPRMLVTVLRVSLAVFVNCYAAAVDKLQHMYNGYVGHSYANKHVVARMLAIRLVPLVNSDVSFPVEQASGVFIADKSNRFSVKYHDYSLIWDVGEVGGNPMPGPLGRGRAIPSQADRCDYLSGVCNEQGPTAKAKVCSGLHGNMQRSAEMTGPVDIAISDDYICQQVTDRNTDYIYLRPHVDRQYVPLNPDRWTYNQDAIWKLIGWAGNMTTSGRKFQGVLKD